MDVPVRQRPLRRLQDRALGRLAIEGVKAIREVDPGGPDDRVDPGSLVCGVPASGPTRSGRRSAAKKTTEKAFEAWDTLFGKRGSRSWGAAPEILDIVGVNV